MIKELRRHIMMQSGEVPFAGWIFGKKYASMNSTDTTIIDDQDYCLSPYIPVTETYLLISLGRGGDQTGVVKEFSGTSCIDFWGDRGGENREITLSSSTNLIRFCIKTSVLDISYAAYLNPTDPYLSYYYFNGRDVLPIITENNVINFYIYSAKGLQFSRSTQSACLNQFFSLDPNVQSFNRVSFYTGYLYEISVALTEYDANYNYIDYWGGQAAERTVNLHSNARFVLLSMPRSTSLSAYIKYASTGEYIWKGLEVV